MDCFIQHHSLASINCPDITVLVTDDNAVQRKLTCFYLEQLGTKTYEADNGKEAIRLVQTTNVDIVLMDDRLSKPTIKQYLALMINHWCKNETVISR